MSTNNTVPIVDHDTKNDRYGIKYTELISPIIKAIQELYNEVKGVLARVIRVEEKVVNNERSIASNKSATDIRMAKLEAENLALKKKLEKIEKLLEKSK